MFIAIGADAIPYILGILGLLALLFTFIAVRHTIAKRRDANAVFANSQRKFRKRNQRNPDGTEYNG